MSDKVKLERFTEDELRQKSTDDLVDMLAHRCNYLAETIETLAGDMMERGTEVGQLGERVNGSHTAAMAIIERLDELSGQMKELGLKWMSSANGRAVDDQFAALSKHLADLAGKVGGLEKDRDTIKDDLVKSELAGANGLEHVLQRIQALEAANSGREGCPDISEPHGRAVSDKPSAGEISAFRPYKELTPAEMAALRPSRTKSEKQGILKEVQKRSDEWEARAQAWEAVAHKLACQLRPAVAPSHAWAEDKVAALAEYEALNGGK